MSSGILAFSSLVDRAVKCVCMKMTDTFSAFSHQCGTESCLRVVGCCGQCRCQVLSLWISKEKSPILFLIISLFLMGVQLFYVKLLLCLRII